MATDFILFIHGVNSRSESAFRQQAQTLFTRIQTALNDSSRILKPVYLFWGNVGAQSTQLLLDDLKASPQWSEFWFRNFRNEQIVPFVGDAALYLSRNVSGQIVRQITDQALTQMGLTLETLRANPTGDRLHLVTHSWGTVILFDILFAPRWNDGEVDPAVRQNVEDIRTSVFGLGSEPNRNYGLPILSVHTMGSPIALFSLLNATQGRSFNLTPNLKELLESLYRVTGEQLPWLNYAHPGDPIAYPLAGVMPLLLEEAQQYVRINDVITGGNPFFRLFSQTLLPLIKGGEAHGSYWKNQDVSTAIAKAIRLT